MTAPFLSAKAGHGLNLYKQTALLAQNFVSFK